MSTRQPGDLPAWLGLLLMALVFVAGGYVEQALPDPAHQVQP